MRISGQVSAALLMWGKLLNDSSFFFFLTKTYSFGYPVLNWNLFTPCTATGTSQMQLLYMSLFSASEFFSFLLQFPSLGLQEVSRFLFYPKMDTGTSLFLF